MAKNFKKYLVTELYDGSLLFLSDCDEAYVEKMCKDISEVYRDGFGFDGDGYFRKSGFFYKSLINTNFDMYGSKADTIEAVIDAIGYDRKYVMTDYLK